MLTEKEKEWMERRKKNEKEAIAIALDKAWAITDDYAYLEAYQPERVE